MRKIDWNSIFLYLLIVFGVGLYFGYLFMDGCDSTSESEDEDYDHIIMIGFVILGFCVFQMFRFNERIIKLEIGNEYEIEMLKKDMEYLKGRLEK